MSVGTELDGKCIDNAVRILDAACCNERGLHWDALPTPASGNEFIVQHGYVNVRLSGDFHALEHAIVKMQRPHS